MSELTIIGSDLFHEIKYENTIQLIPIEGIERIHIQDHTFNKLAANGTLTIFYDNKDKTIVIQYKDETFTELHKQYLAIAQKMKRLKLFKLYYNKVGEI